MPALAIEKRLVSVEHAAEALGLGRSFVFELIRTGSLESIKCGRARRVPVDAIDRYVRDLRSEELQKRLVTAGGLRVAGETLAERDFRRPRNGAALLLVEAVCRAAYGLSLRSEEGVEPPVANRSPRVSGTALRTDALDGAG